MDLIFLQPSTPYPDFEETFEAYYDSGVCPQMESGNILGSLNCLHLNIYVPKSASSQNRVPVLVWIHGGGFSSGSSGSFGPKFLVRNDIVVVTINYRLGPYGFMCLGIPEVPGNQGLKDQLLALQWINDNIHSFGGDVNKITVMGESAGAMSIDLHLHSAQGKLFRSAILQSGMAFLPGLIRDPRPELTLQLAAKLGFSTDDVIQALTFVASVDSHLVIAAASSMDFGSFFPCIEKQFDNIERLIPDYPVNTDVPNVRNMPVLIGFNDKEGLFQYANKGSEYFETHPDLFANYLKNGFNFDNNKLDEMEILVRHFYLGDEKISEIVKLAIIDMVSDFCFNHPIQRTVAKYLENGANNIYHYVFSYIGQRNLMSGIVNTTIEGATHGDELGYLFDFSQWHEVPSPEDQLVIDRMTTMWANFVKYRYTLKTFFEIFINLLIVFVSSFIGSFI